uniref:Neurotransmitter-gated ion-channel ligand-binding domain-containing protein n=1 Tax=Panagrellus redivivus TaxID=6233 RepID=A0A7E4V8Z1_PANRE
MQHLELNVWVIQKWNDAFLGWDPHKYGSINSTILPYDRIWLPDTYVYNSVVMNREETERYINVVVSTEYWKRKRGAVVKFMYPALYRTTCRLNIRYFPYDQQTCTLIISSWTSDKSAIDYEPEFDSVNLENFIPNEEWVVVSFNVKRVEQKFVCCPQPWVLLEATLIVRRKPLYYIVNLVIPTSVITLVAVTGFFTPASTSNERREKLSLGIDSLLAHSLLLMMVSEQMPTTSDYVPLFGLFYLSIIAIIFVGTLFTAFILNIHLQKTHNKLIPPLVSYIFFRKIAVWLAIRPSTTLLELWMETGVRIEGFEKMSGMRARCALKKRADDNKKREREKPEKKGKIGSKHANGDENHHYLLASDPLPILTNNIGVQGNNNNNITLLTSRPPSIQSTSPRYDPAAKPPPSPVSDPAGGGIARRRNTPQASIAARNNWKRLAQRASAKRREESADIPYADCSTPQIGASRPAWANRSASTSMPLPALQLLGLQSGGGRGSAGSNDNAMLHAKLRRRNAQEWEFLATVLDRVLLIVFSILVITVTVVVMAVGQVIHFNYALEDERNNVTSKLI